MRIVKGRRGALKLIDHCCDCTKFSKCIISFNHNRKPFSGPIPLSCLLPTATRAEEKALLQDNA